MSMESWNRVPQVELSRGDEMRTPDEVAAILLRQNSVADLP
jgi:hypothetical protein